MTLICVVMGAESRDVRNAEASRLLDYGFATYGLFTAEEGTLPPVPVTRGREDEVSLTHPRFTAVLPKADMGAVERTVTLPDAIPAPVRAGEAVGKITYTCKGISLGEVPITAAADVEKLGFWDIWRRIFWGMIG
jgi:D-alanyl-D-alanine carboxypeptidase (penicillin-binding protein 5/6)